MSRRKQSNPKPLKRKTEDSLEEVAELLHLPTDLFSVRDPEDDVHEYTIFTRRLVREGLHFGPYGGHVAHHHLHPEDTRNVIETKGRNGERIHFVVTEDSGGWLKLLKPTSSYDVGNVALFYNESSIWCTITSDIDPESEILVNHRWAGSLTPPRARSPDERPASPCRPLDDRRGDDSDGERIKARLGYEQSMCDRNGSVSSDSLPLKYEPTSPVSPNSSAASPTTMVLPKHKTSQGEPASAEGPLCLPYMNGCNYPPAFPYGGLMADSVTDGHFKCDVCNASFNNRRILEVHQAYYCQGKPFSTTLSCSDTDTEENTTTKSEPRPSASPAASEDDDSLPHLRGSNPPKHPPTSPLPKRRRTPSSSGGEPSSRLPPRLFKCPYCSYSTDKKASLTRHVRLHGSSPGSAECDLPLATPPIARYCANCDIQFASFKNYQVHKEFYCNTRHVHKSTLSSSSPNHNHHQQPTSQQQPPPQTNPQQQQPPHSPDPTSSPKPPFGMVQPLYAAISTSPLILVPCSYVSGGPPAASGLVPAGNIIIPNPASPDAESPASVIPTFTVASSASDDKEKTVKAEEKEEKLVEKESCGGGEKPLDLSCRRKEEEEDRKVKAVGDAGSRTSVFTTTSSTSSSSEESTIPPSSVPPLPLVTSPLDISLLTRSQIPVLDHALAPVLAPPQVLVKQGTSKCKECNIVFYKHENYLVHKNRYCASRLQPATTVKRDTASPTETKVKQPDSPGSPSDREETASRLAPSKSPISSPRVSNPRTPPAPMDEPREPSPSGGAPLLQFFCAQCGIKYSSVDNLRAHQLYYCPHREPQLQQPREFRCSKCKNAYPSEDLLRTHPCGSQQRKCPYCDVYCPTLSAAQRHLVSHTGIKSFRCSLCGYKGHTLRGMRTHIRIHLDKASSAPEEAYILCMDEGGAEIGCAGRKATSPRANAERIKSVIGTEPPEPVVTPEDPVASTDATHWCQICGYSSSYKGNVVRHVKLVHKDLVTSSSQAMSTIVNTRPMVEPKEDPQPSEVKPLVVNGLHEKGLKTEAVSPPPPPPPEGVVTPPKGGGVKRTLPTEDPQSFPPQKGPKYCKSCDISFNYLSNFLAHKKFYCTPRPGEVAGQDSTTVQSVQ